MRTVLRRRLAQLTVASAALATACSLVNSFDDVTPSGEGTYGASTPTALDGSSGDGGAAPDADSGPAAKGAIVVAGQVEVDGALAATLAVLDPATGREIGPREALVVSAIRYDGATDTWYLFESKGASFFPGPSDRVVLHSRKLDLTSGTWTELGAVDVPTMQSYDAIALAKERIAYVSYASDAGGAALVTLSTTDPAKVVQTDFETLDRAPRSLVARRSRGGAGGTFTMLRTVTGNPECDGGAICPAATRARVDSNATALDQPKIIGGAQAGSVPPPTGASFLSLDREALVFPRISFAGGSTRLALWDPVLEEFDGPIVTAEITDSLIRQPAVAECERVVFVVAGNSDLNLYAIPMPATGTGTVTKIGTGHSGQAVYYEPTTKTVLAPFGQGTNFDLSAFRFGGTPTEPTLARRETDWDPPTDIRPVVVGVRETLPISCP